MLQQARRQEEARGNEVKTQPTVKPTLQNLPTRESCDKGIFCTVKTKSDKSLYHTMCQVTETSINSALQNCWGWVRSAGPPGKVMICECERRLW